MPQWMPPRGEPLPNSRFHSSLPVSGSSAHNVPDFWPANSTSLPSARFARMGAAPKSRSSSRPSLRTVECLLRPQAGGQEDVVLRGLEFPAQLARLHVDGEHRIRGVRGGRRRGLARAHVDQPAPFVHHGRCPDRRARRTPQHLAVTAIAHGLRIGHGVVAPHHPAVAHVQRREHAVRLAALVRVLAAEIDLGRRDRHVHAIADDQRRARGVGEIPAPHRRLPDQLAAGRIHQVHVHRRIRERDHGAARGQHAIGDAGAQRHVAGLHPLEAGRVTEMSVAKTRASSVTGRNSVSPAIAACARMVLARGNASTHANSRSFTSPVAMPACSRVS